MFYLDLKNEVERNLEGKNWEKKVGVKSFFVVVWVRRKNTKKRTIHFC